jgi:hypothetical protein
MGAIGYWIGAAFGAQPLKAQKGGRDCPEATLAGKV